MSYRAGFSAGIGALIGEPGGGVPTITCDVCRVSRITISQWPPKWFLDNRPKPGWAKASDGDRRYDACPRCVAAAKGVKE